MTELQQKLIEYYKEYYKKHKLPPRVIDAAKYFKAKHQTISERINTLVKKGYFEKISDGFYRPTKKKVIVDK